MCNKRGIVHTLTRLPGAAGVGTARHGSELEAPKIARVRPVAGPGRAADFTPQACWAAQLSGAAPAPPEQNAALSGMGWTARGLATHSPAPDEVPEGPSRHLEHRVTL